MSDHSVYRNPLESRYGSKEMLYIFSDTFKIATWRQLWIALAESQQELGLEITDEQIEAMKKARFTIDFDKAAAYEKKFDHDVVAHIHTFGDAAPEAKGIIHMGATSAYVVDNTDIIQARNALRLIRSKIVEVLTNMAAFAEKYKAMPTLAYTHLQAAQLTTVGKRTTLWMESLLTDLKQLDSVYSGLALRGVKGTTGTAASFKTLFNGDYHKYKAMEAAIVHKLGFEKAVPVSGQTYDRKTDVIILQMLSNIAQSAHKFTNDLRILQHLKEIEEPFKREQVGSSAMPYKRNPIKSERISSLAKFVMSLLQANTQVAATQWLERTLDDSANKRLAQPQAFIAVDAILETWAKLTGDLVVYPNMIARHINDELPFMASEVILMELVRQGKSRQEAHEKIRTLAMTAGENVKKYGKENNLIELIKSDDYFAGIHNILDDLMKPENFTGFCEEQVNDYLGAVKPYLS
jgi:adenylosuccinate lyase